MTDAADNKKLTTDQSDDQTIDVNAHKALVKTQEDDQKDDTSKQASIERQITAIDAINKNHDGELKTLT